MGIFSTFDPKFQKKSVLKNKEKYGEENIVHITKSKLFLWVKVLLPSIFLTGLLIFLLTLVVVYVGIERLMILLIIVILVFWMIPMWHISKLYLDYEMDFVLVTPVALVRYNQEGFFKRISKTIDLKDIRSTSVRKTNFLHSLFNNGNLVFLSEGGEMESDERMRVGEIVFRFVYHPDKVNFRVNKLLRNI